uniref:LRRCT domain-containing protein n=1 Tax=Caenorhabditis tropicalis TaxID=1561998 RepID=A0A1I7TMA0_9PELO
MLYNMINVCRRRDFRFQRMTSTTREALFLVIFSLIATASSRTIPCLDGCKCDLSEDDPVIRCDELGLDRFPLPHSSPLKGFHFLALTCNDIETIPAISMIKASFPDLQGIDVQGNTRLNCSHLASLHSEIPVLSDCDNEKPLQCDNLDKSCDWKCRALAKLKEMWAQFKDLVNRKAKEWQAEETIEAAKDWFSAQFKKFKVAIGDLSD